MKFTLSWLKDHLKIDATLDQLVERLTSIGLEVESIDDKAALKPFVIAKVLTASRHPNADNLQVLTVDTGVGTPIQVVCGASNARVGLVGAFAAPGTYVPGIDVTLSIGKIRGVESHGMMCSERELNLSNEHNDIIDLPADAPIGTSFAVYAHIDDPIIEISLTPNRPDATSVYGIARDLAASGLGTLKGGQIEPIAGAGACPIKVSIEVPELCLGFALRLVRGVKNSLSPKWMQQRLLAIGLRPINSLVDIANYITFDRGRPLHVFDAKKISGNLVVRCGREGDRVLALDCREYALTTEICVISDDQDIVSIAGVIGSKHCVCNESTTDVLIESALWTPLNIVRACRTLGIVTDARYRFERGVDPEFMVPGVELATNMVLELCGGQPTQINVVNYTGHVDKVVSFPLSEVKRLTGIEIDKAESLDILTRLGFSVNGNGDVVEVSVPSWRPDVNGKADLVEEVMRIHGIDKITPQSLSAHDAVNGRILTTLQIRTRSARRALAVRGMIEAITWSYIPAKHAELFGGGQETLKLSNPISADMSDMRPALLPGLIVAAQRNADRGLGDVALFEVSDTYENDMAEGQRRVASGVRRGTAKLEGSGRHWLGNAGNVSVFDAKADAIALLEACGVPVDRLQIETGAPAWYHPGRSGVIKLGPKVVLGTFGEFHPKTLEGLDVSSPLCGFEVYIDIIPEPQVRPTKTKPKLDLSSFQAVKRDFAFVVDKAVTVGTLTCAALDADKQLIAGVSVFDIFESSSLGAGKKSVAMEVTIQPVAETLTDKNCEALAAKIVESVKKQTGGSLRERSPSGEEHIASSLQGGAAV